MAIIAFFYIIILIDFDNLLFPFCKLLSEISKFTWLKSVIPENVKLLKTLSIPILGIVNYPWTIEIGLNLICVVLFKIQSAFISKVSEVTCPCIRILFLTLFIVENEKSRSADKFFYIAEELCDIPNEFEKP